MQKPNHSLILSSIYSIFRIDVPWNRCEKAPPVPASRHLATSYRYNISNLHHFLITAFVPAKQLSLRTSDSPRAPSRSFPSSSSSFSFSPLIFIYFHEPFKIYPREGEESADTLRGHVSCNFHRVGGYPLFRITGSLPAPILS